MIRNKIMQKLKLNHNCTLLFIVQILQNSIHDADTWLNK